MENQMIATNSIPTAEEIFGDLLNHDSTGVLAYDVNYITSLISTNVLSCDVIARRITVASIFNDVASYTAVLIRSVYPKFSDHYISLDVNSPFGKIDLYNMGTYAYGVVNANNAREIAFAIAHTTISPNITDQLDLLASRTDCILKFILIMMRFFSLCYAAMCPSVTANYNIECPPSPLPFVGLQTRSYVTPFDNPYSSLSTAVF